MGSTNLQAVTRQMEEIDTSEMDGKYLTFWTDRQLYGLPIAHVVQIVGMQAVTEVPDFPSYAKGIINLRGSIIPLIDVRLRLGKQEAPYNEHTCIIVTDICENGVGFIVDDVDSVNTIADHLIAPPPTIASGASGYIIGVGKLENRIVLLMDIHKMVTGKTFNLLNTSEEV